MRAQDKRERRGPGRVEWTVRGLLALLFLFTGIAKLVLPMAALTVQALIPEPFLRFLGICEVLGALGLVLPGLLRVHEELTWLAAGGLVIIMSGAVGATLATGSVAPALIPLAVGLLAGYVAYEAVPKAAASHSEARSGEVERHAA